MNLGRALLGLLVTALGVLFLLDGLDVIDAGRTISAVWPVALIAVGGVQLIENRRVAAGPLIVIGVGLVLLGSTTGIVPLDWSLLWPIALIGLGLWFVLGRGGSAPGADDADDRVQAMALLGGRELRTSSRAFSGGSLTAFMGGVAVDLRDATLAEGGATLDITAIMGGVDLRVPETWRVDQRAMVILGGFDDKRRRTAATEEGPRLTITGLVLMGGGDIKS
jgi:hypothetical protein